MDCQNLYIKFLSLKNAPSPIVLEIDLKIRVLLWHYKNSIYYVNGYAVYQWVWDYDNNGCVNWENCGDGGTPIQETPWGPLIGKQSY